MHVSANTDIAAPRQVVWNYIVDPARHLNFMDGMTKWEIEGARRNGLGARFSMRMRIGSVEMGGRIEIVEFDPPCDLAWTSITGIDHRGRWRLRTVTGRTTHVELRVTYHAIGILAHLADLVASLIVRRHLRRSVDALKQQLEALPRSFGKTAATARPRAHGRAMRATTHG